MRGKLFGLVKSLSGLLSGKVFGWLLVVLGLVCMAVSAGLVISGGTPFYPVGLGGLAGAALAAGTIELVAPIEVYGRDAKA